MNWYDELKLGIKAKKQGDNEIELLVYLTTSDGGEIHLSKEISLNDGDGVEIPLRWKLQYSLDKEKCENISSDEYL